MKEAEVETEETIIQVMCIVNGKVSKREGRRPTSTKKETGPVRMEDVRIRISQEEQNATYATLLNPKFLSNKVLIKKNILFPLKVIGGAENAITSTSAGDISVIFAGNIGIGVIGVEEDRAVITGAEDMMTEEEARREEDMILLILVRYLAVSLLREVEAEIEIEIEEDIKEDIQGPGPGLDLGLREKLRIEVLHLKRRLNNRMVIVYIK